MGLSTYRNGTLIDTAAITFTELLDAKDSASFEMNTASDTLVYNDLIEIYIDADAMPAFTGYVSGIEGTHPRSVTCIGYLDALSQCILAENNTKTIVDSGKVHTAIGIALTCYDPDGADTLAWVNDQYNATANRSYYVIVSDQTKGTTTLDCQNGANDYIGYGRTLSNTTNEANAYTNVHHSEDGDFTNAWRSDYTQTTVGYQNHAEIIHLALENYSVAKTNTVDHIDVEAMCKCIVAPNATHAGELMFFGLGLGNTNTADNMFSNVLAADSVIINAASVQTKVLYVHVTRTLSANSEVFGDGAVNLKDGYIGIWGRGYLASAGSLPQTFLYWTACKVTVYYASGTFTTINVPITDTQGPNILTQAATNFQTLGVISGDGWTITNDMAEALQNCFTSIIPATIPAVNINNGVAIGKGVALELYGADGYQMMCEILKTAEFHYFVENTWGKQVTILKVADMIDDGAIDTPHPDSSASLEEGARRYIVVVWRDSIIVKDCGTGSGVYKEVDKSIVTAASAQERADALAVDHNVDRYSVHAIWHHLPAVRPKVGHKFDITVSGVTYTDQACRRVTYTHDGALGKWTVEAWLGLGSTPSVEKQWKELGAIRKDFENDKLSSMTTPYTGVSRHAQLNGVNGSTDQYHVSSVQYNGGDLNAGQLDSHDSSYFEVAGTAASKIASSISDGDTTHAPDGNSVFDALAAKAPLASPSFTTQITVPATVEASGQATAIKIKDAEHVALDITEGANSYLFFDTTNGAERVVASKQLQVPEDAYNAGTWDGNQAVPTKNAVRDKFETLGTASTHASGDFLGVAAQAADSLLYGGVSRAQQFVAFRATTATATNLVNNTLTKVPFGTEVYDTDGGYDPTTNKRWNCQTTGYYHFDVHVMLDESAGWGAGERANIAVYYDGAFVNIRGDRWQADAASTRYLTLQLSWDMLCTAGHYVEIYVYQNSGGDIALYGDATFNWWSGHRVA
jgi:hypothetical protein